MNVHDEPIHRVWWFNWISVQQWKKWEQKCSLAHLIDLVNFNKIDNKTSSCTTTTATTTTTRESLHITDSICSIWFGDNLKVEYSIQFEMQYFSSVAFCSVRASFGNRTKIKISSSNVQSNRPHHSCWIAPLKSEEHWFVCKRKRYDRIFFPLTSVCDW